MQYVIDAGVDELLLFILKILSHVIGHEDDAAFTTHHKQKPIQRLKERRVKTLLKYHGQIRVAH